MALEGGFQAASWLKWYSVWLHARGAGFNTQCMLDFFFTFCEF